MYFDWDWAYLHLTTLESLWKPIRDGATVEMRWLSKLFYFFDGRKNRWKQSENRKWAKTNDKYKSKQNQSRASLGKQTHKYTATHTYKHTQAHTYTPTHIRDNHTQPVKLKTFDPKRAWNASFCGWPRQHLRIIFAFCFPSSARRN